MKTPLIRVHVFTLKTNDLYQTYVWWYATLCIIQKLQFVKRISLIKNEECPENLIKISHSIDIFDADPLSTSYFKIHVLITMQSVI